MVQRLTEKNKKSQAAAGRYPPARRMRPAEHAGRLRGEPGLHPGPHQEHEVQRLQERQPGRPGEQRPELAAAVIQAEADPYRGGGGCISADDAPTANGDSRGGVARQAERTGDWDAPSDATGACARGASVCACVALCKPRADDGSNLVGSPSRRAVGGRVGGWVDVQGARREGNEQTKGGWKCVWGRVLFWHIMFRFARRSKTRIHRSPPTHPSIQGGRTRAQKKAEAFYVVSAVDGSPLNKFTAETVRDPREPVT
jgi:hypothetical protein